MAQQNISIGTTANDNTGDVPRVAAGKINSNFTEVYTAIGTKAPLADAVLTGAPTAPTPTLTDNTTKLATTAFVKGQAYLTTAPVTSVAGKTGVVTLAAGDLTATGIKDATTFLRGDNTWGVPAGSGGGTTGTAAPTTGAHVVGEFIRNSAPTEQGSVGAKFINQGWTCITAGTPGTWVANNVFTGN